MLRSSTLGLIILLFCSLDAAASVTRLRIERRETVLNGRPFGAAGPYEKIVGKVDFALDPARPQNRGIVDLNLAPKNAQGLVEFSADFYLLKPIDPARGNGRLFYEAGNRGTKRILPVFQDAANSADPATDAEFGNGALMRAGIHAAVDGMAVGRARRPHADGDSHRHQQRPADHRLGARQFHSGREAPPAR